MAHKQQIEFCMKIKGLFPQFFFNKRVLDIGSMDVNGSNRYLFWNCNYVGIDIGPGKNVDYVSYGHEFRSFPDYWDTIITTEVAEHDKHWTWTMQNIMRLLKPGGLLLFTCATTGRPEHGTTRTDEFSSPFTTDYYLNITEEMVRSIPLFNEHWQYIKFSVNEESHDLQLVAVKKGGKFKFKPSLISRILVSFVQFFYLRIRDIKDFIRRKFTSSFLPVLKLLWT